jgi:hypothetical protein
MTSPRMSFAFRSSIRWLSRDECGEQGFLGSWLMGEITMKRIAAMLVLFFALGGGAIGQLRELQVIGFAGGPKRPLWLADEKGYFADEGLGVHFTPTPSSTLSRAWG